MNKEENDQNNTNSVKKRHKWDFLTDICKKCGIERRTIAMTTYTLLVKGFKKEYKVNGKWTTEIPNCKQ